MTRTDVVDYLTPWRAGAIAYLLVALIAEAWAAVILCAVLWGLIELRRRHRARRGEPSAFDGHGRTVVAPSRGMAELVLGSVLLARDGIRRSLMTAIGWTLLAVLVVCVAGMATLAVLVLSGRGYPLVVGLVVVAGVALWRRRSTHGDHGHDPSQGGGASGGDAPQPVPWRQLVVEGHHSTMAPTDHYRRQARHANHLREEEAVQVYAQGRADGAGSMWGRRAGRREASYGQGYANGFDAGAEAVRAAVWDPHS